MIRSSTCGIVALLAALLSGVAAQEGPKMEKVSIEDGSGASSWGAAEATATLSKEFAERGETSLLFHIDVDHTAGEPKYPIGWPRIHYKPPEELRDWTGYDFLELVIHSETSREELPGTPLGFIAHTPDKANGYNRQLTELRAGETTTIVIPLSSIPRHNHVPHIQLYISESNYTHGDVVDFYVDDIALTRYAEPGLSDIASLHSVAFSDATHLGVKFRLLGVEQGKTATVKGRLRLGDRVMAEGEWNLPRGGHEVWLELTGAVQPGEASLELYLTEPKEVAKVRIIPSPFAEEEGGN